MRVVCFVVGLLALAASGVFLVLAVFGVSGILGVRIDDSQHVEVATLFALFGIAWMVAAVAFRPATRLEARAALDASASSSHAVPPSVPGV